MSFFDPAKGDSSDLLADAGRLAFTNALGLLVVVPPYRVAAQVPSAIRFGPA